MPNEPLVPLPGSERDPLPRAVEAGPPSATARAELTVVLRRQAPGALGAAATDVELARSVFSGLGLTVTSVHTASRRFWNCGRAGRRVLRHIGADGVIGRKSPTGTGWADCSCPSR